MTNVAWSAPLNGWSGASSPSRQLPALNPGQTSQKGAWGEDGNAKWLLQHGQVPVSGHEQRALRSERGFDKLVICAVAANGLSQRDRRHPDGDGLESFKPRCRLWGQSFAFS